MDYLKLSKEISYALRHAPWEYGLELDEDGFAPLDKLVEAINGKDGYGRRVTKEDVLEAVRRSDKKRHEVRGNLIRALYGHSIPEKVERQPSEPPAILYHGTTHAAADRILAEGLRPMSRQYVHLSPNAEVALQVGQRRDSHPIVLRVSAEKAAGEGVGFYVGNDKVWLSDVIPPKFITRLEE